MQTPLHTTKLRVCLETGLLYFVLAIHNHISAIKVTGLLHFVVRFLLYVEFGTGTEMAQLVCGGCHIHLMYMRGATSVQCSCCHTVNLALEGKNNSTFEHYKR